MRCFTLVTVLLASLSLGCEFVSEINAEMERGQRELDQFAINEAAQSRRGRTHDDSGGEAGPADSSPGPAQRAARAAGDWWKKARTLASDEVDPSIVRCEMAGRLHFMREDECRARGGRVSRG
jgi:hypothetical protein